MDEIMNVATNATTWPEEIFLDVLVDGSTEEQADKIFYDKTVK